MKIIDNRNREEKVMFRELDIGDAYFDREGNLCIKTSDDECADENCITYSHDEWSTECEATDERVVRARATITID